MTIFHLVIDASQHSAARSTSDSHQSFPPDESSHLGSEDILGLARGLLTRRIFFKESEISLTIVGSDVSGNSMSYEYISHFGIAPHEDHLEFLRQVSEESRQAEDDRRKSVGDLFEGFIIAIDQALKSEGPGEAAEIHIVGSNLSLWEADEASSESVKNSIARNKEKLRITFVGPQPCPFALWADPEVVISSGSEIPTSDHSAPQKPSTQEGQKEGGVGTSLYSYMDPRRWCCEVLLKPGIKSVKAVTTCRTPLDFCNGGFELPGYMYLSTKENPLPSMKKGEPQGGGGGDATTPGATTTTPGAAVIMNRVQFTQNDEGMEEEIEAADLASPEEIITAYIYGDRFVPINAIDRSLIELPAEEKSLKVVDVVEESVYETYFIHGQTSLFVPDPTFGATSYVAMRDLCGSLKRQKLGLVARLKARANHSPKLILMLPANRKREFPTELSWCLTMNNLTYSGDLRRHNFVTGRRSLSSEKISTAYEIVRRNSLEAKSKLIRWNPAYRRLLTILVAKTYDEHAGPTDLSELCDWIDQESDKTQPPPPPLNIPENTAELFAIRLKVTRVEDRLRTWKEATQINLTDMFPDVIVIDRTDPVNSLNDLMKEHRGEVLTLIKIVTIFGDLINETLVTNRGQNFPELLRALKDATLLSVTSTAQSASDDAANLVEAYNQIVAEAISIVKLDRQVFVDVEAALKPSIFILASETSAGRSFEEANRLIQSIQDAPAKQVDLPTQDTSGAPVTQPDFRDEEFDDLE